MIVPVRCFSCGKVLADSYETFAEEVRKGEEPAKVLDRLGFSRYCCRRMLLSHVDLLAEITQYKI